MEALGFETFRHGRKRVSWLAFKKTRDEPVKVFRQVEAQFGVEVQCRLQVERHRTVLEGVGHGEGSVYRPFVRTSSTFDGPTPLDESCLLADVDLLSASNQPDHDTPLRNAL